MTDHALDARLLDVDLFFHTHSPADNVEMVSLLSSSLESAKQEWMAAHAVHDEDGEARAVAEWCDVVRVLGAAVDGLRAQQRAIAAAGMPPMVVLILERP
jgi:hypothetical protein